MAAPASGQWRAEEQAAEMVEVLQAATRMLAGVALRSLDVLDGAVSLPQFRVLALLGALGPTQSTQVARALGLDASSVTRLADRLVAAGHVVRGGDPSNRKLVTLGLTDTGRALVLRVAEWRRQELTGILRLLEPAERDTLTVALRRLVEVAGEGYGIIARGPVPLLQPDMNHRHRGPV
jgi:DNA-binding MarR family transcriptional regulator